MMARIAAILTALVLAAPSVAQARARRAPRPKLLLTVTAAGAPAAQLLMAKAVEKALGAAVDAAPLAVRSLGLGPKATPKKIAWTLRRRRMRHYSLTGMVSAVSHRVVNKGGVRTLMAEATVTVTCTSADRRRKKSFEVKAKGGSATPISVLLQGEILASRIAAGRAAAKKALTAVLAKLLPQKKRGRR